MLEKTCDLTHCFILAINTLELNHLVEIRIINVSGKSYEYLDIELKDSIMATSESLPGR